jgi:hypothetical protein
MNDIKKIQEFFSKSLEEATFKVGDKVTYLGHPGEITGINKEMTGAITYNVAYDKGNGRTKATNLSNKGGEIKPLKEGEKSFADYDNKELAAYARELSKQRADAASKGQSDLLGGINKKIEAATRELKKRSQKIKSLTRTDVNEQADEESVNENKPVANVNRHIKAIQIQLDQLGVKYEMSGNPYKPFKAVYKPINKDDKWYDNFEDIVFRYNLGGVVKTSMDEAKKETGVDMAKKQLDALGVKYEMSKTDKVRPFKVIYKPINKEDDWYDKFEEIVDLFNLKGFVKQSMSESLTAGYPHRKTSGEGFEKIVITEPMDDATRERMIRRFEAEGWDAKPNFGGGITAVKKTLMNEDFAKFDTLKMAINQHEKGEPYYDKTRLINIFNQLDNPDQERAKKEYSEYFGKSVNESNGFKSGKEFINIKLQKYPKAVAKINQLISIVGESNFTMEMAEWLFDFFNNASYESPVNEAKSEDKVDTITMDIPLFLRMLEYSREDAEQDLDLHDVTEKANKLGKERGILQMDDYEEIVGIDGEGNDLDENVAPNHTGKAAPFGSGYKPLEEKIAKALDQINEELCPAGKAYRKRRMAAGEKSSAYLSGRAVKVCKGQMSGKKKK